jgi:quinolinate synthase
MLFINSQDQGSAKAMPKLMDSKEMLVRIGELRQARRAVILVHNYQLGEVQDVGDFVGDSLELSRQAAATAAEVIVFCGVHFMAETAAILSPKKTVLLPVKESGCPMADMATADEVRALKAQHPGAIVVTYVNSTAAVKAESDVCVTSANAAGIVGRLPKDRPIIFLPDRNLGAWVAKETGREMILWPGFCPTHMWITREALAERKREFPRAQVIIHPECRMEVIAMADVVLSTGGMLKHVRESQERQFIVATEIGIIHRLRKENPGKQFVPVSEQAVCPNMKLIRLGDVLRALEKNEHVITVPEELRLRALRPIEVMLGMAKPA